MNHLVSFFEIAVNAMRKHVLDKQRMRFVAHFEDVLRIYVTEALKGGLKVVQGLAQISLRRENDGLHAIVGVRNRLGLGHGQ